MIVQRTASDLAQIGSISFREAAGLAVIGEARIRSLSGLDTIFSPAATLVLSVSGDAHGAGASNFAITITTSAVTVSVNGGQAPYTFAWSRVDGPDAFWSILGPSSATAQFRRSTMAPGDQDSATFNCTVTDALGNQETTITITATVANYGGLGGPLP